MRRLVALLAVTAGALVAANAVLADSPLLATNGGFTGVVHGDTRYLLAHLPTGQTNLAAVSTADGTVLRHLVVGGGPWYFPNTPGGAGGLSHDGKTLFLVDVTDKARFSASTYLVVDPLRMKLVRRLTPYASACSVGSFCGPSHRSYLVTDALSPDASRLYAVSITDVDSGVASPCSAEYGYDLRRYHSLSMREDDRRKGSEGTAVTRATSADGRWVYTLYRASGSGSLFIQTLDTVGAAVHCVYLPGSRGADGGLSLRDHDRTLGVSSASGSPWLNVAVGSWRISRAPDAFPWVWLAAGLGGLALLSVGGSVLLRRRGEEVEEHAG